MSRVYYARLAQLVERPIYTGRVASSSLASRTSKNILIMTKRYSLKKNTGFTLIELMVVISIISLLSSIVLANLSTARDKALVAKQQEETHQADIDISLNLDRDNRTYTLTGDTDNYFTVDSGMYDLQNISTGNGVIIPLRPPPVRTEVLALSGGKDSDASEIYYYHNNAWKQLGQPYTIDLSSTLLPQYFIIRTRPDDPDIHITLPNNVTYHGNTAQNGSPRPW
jgi:prepilin-type N-terminal cleavage/methylation domain-containing protein